MEIIDEFSGPFLVGHEYPSGALELSENDVSDWCFDLEDGGAALYAFSTGREYNPLDCINELDALVKSEHIQDSSIVKGVRLYFARALTARLTGVPWDRMSERLDEINLERHVRHTEVTYGDTWSGQDAAPYVELREVKTTHRVSDQPNCWQSVAVLFGTSIVLGTITYSDGKYIAAPADKSGPLYQTDSINKAKRYLHTF